MTKKELFLSFKTWDEYQANKDRVKGLLYDEDIKNHLNKIAPRLDNSDYEKGIITEVYKNKNNK